MKKWKNIALTVALLGLLVCLASRCESRLSPSRKESDLAAQKALEDFCKRWNLDPGKYVLEEWEYGFYRNNNPQDHAFITLNHRGVVGFQYKNRGGFYNPASLGETRDGNPVGTTTRPDLSLLDPEEADRITKALEGVCQEYDLDPDEFLLKVLCYTFYYDNDPDQYVGVTITDRGKIEFGGNWPDVRDEEPVVPTGRPRMSPLNPECQRSPKLDPLAINKN